MKSILKEKEALKKGEATIHYVSFEQKENGNIKADVNIVENTEKNIDKMFDEVKTWYTVDTKAFNEFCKAEYKDEFEKECAYIKLIIGSPEFKRKKRKSAVVIEQREINGKNCCRFRTINS